MKQAVFLYNTQSGKGKAARSVEAICTVFRAYGYEIEPRLIDFSAILYRSGLFLVISLFLQVSYKMA